MAFQFISALKMCLPPLASIIASVMPAFTAKKEGSNSQDPNSQNFRELQDAITNNSASIKTLAEQVQATVTIIEELSASTNRKLIEQEQWISELRRQLSESNHQAKRAYGISVAAIISVIAIALISALRFFW